MIATPQTMRGLRRLVIGAACLLAAAVPGTAGAADTITLKVAEQFPPTHYFSKLATVPWMERVTELTHGKVQFEHYPAQQLAKASDMLDAMGLGVADVGYVVYTYTASRMPLITGAAALPVWHDVETGYRTLKKVQMSKPVLEGDFLRNGIRPLIPVTAGVMRLWLNGKDVHGVADMKGVKVRSGGGVQDEIIRAMGAVPVQIPAPEIYEAMQRGVVDGALVPTSSAPSYQLDEVATFANYGLGVSGGAMGYVVNEQRWQSLPQDVRDAMTQAADEIGLALAQTMDRRDTEMREKLSAKGITFYDPTPEEAAAFVAAQKPVEDAWVARMEAQGQPAAEVLKDMRDTSATVAQR